MTEAETLHALGRLVGLTTGWNDEAIEAYAAELGRLDDARALLSACDLIGRSWTEARRPPLAHVIATYRAQAQSAPRQALSRGRHIEPAEGVEIARRHFALESERLGRTPNMARFDAIIAPIAARHD